VPLLAFTRPVPDSLAACELTHLERTPIDLERARLQHACYEQALAQLGCTLVKVPAAHDQPDSVFGEDAIVALDEIAIVTRPGARARQAETAAVAEAVGVHRPLAQLTAPATLDGGDVLVLGRTIHVGIGGRTNATGASQLAAITRPFGYDVRSVVMRGCLHLKSAVTQAAADAVVFNPAWVDDVFDGWNAIAIDPDEAPAANVLRIGDRLLAGATFPRTIERLASYGLDVQPVDVSELAKAEAALTCCSVLLVQPSSAG
jgi:dimethylargininase